MSCEEFGLEVTEPGLGYKITSSLSPATPVSQNTLLATAPHQCYLKDVVVSVKGLLSKFWGAPWGLGPAVPPHLPMKAKWKLSWISVTGHLAEQFRQRKSMLDGKCSGNIAASQVQTTLSLNTSSPKVLERPLAKQFQNQHSVQGLLPGARTSLCEGFAVEPNAFPLQTPNSTWDNAEDSRSNKHPLFSPTMQTFSINYSPTSDQSLFCSL